MLPQLKPLLRSLRGRPGVREFLRERLVLDPGAMSWDVVADVTRGCNLSCGMCLTSARTPKAFATPEVVDRLCREVLPRTSDLALGCRSEPLLHPDLPEILAAFRHEIDRLGQDTFLIVLTSGTLLTEGLTHRLAGSGLDLALFSIEATDPEAYGRFRRGGRWEDVARGIRRLLDVRTSDRPGAGVQAIPSRDSLPHLPRLVDDLAALGLTRLHLPQLIPDRPADRDRALSLVGPDAEEVKEALAALVDRGTWLGLEVEPPEPLLPAPEGDLYPLMADNGFWDEAVAARDRPSVCIAPWSRVRIDHEGVVYPCHRTLDRRDAWGSLMQQEFVDIVNGPRAVAMRTALLEGRAPNGSCRRCPFGPAG